VWSIFVNFIVVGKQCLETEIIMFPAEELVKLGITESVRGELYVLTMPKTT
jgi:hypothetical protein